ncbi:hypothetical protein FMN63_00820 [Stappia sp. BW2]|uniref:hypothetical protein n=1 Tax=Stappia sp. BW2 TaxID=2592622 RepID=UPI0011DEE7CC|nr:hypothetical protein [Stappia sp. BW2]TYC79825.1 hypothetical protein FMN63_00820 [Stappia sp. BW2]
MSAEALSSKVPKLLVVEPKLIRNRGHHHTQITALKTLFPDYRLHLIAGEGYDGFAGKATATLSTAAIEKAKLHWHFRHGKLRRKAVAFLRAVFDGGIASYPSSPFGDTILEVCEQLQFDAYDKVIIPSTNLDALESVADLVSKLGEKAPQICMRLLDPTLGDPKERRRLQRMNVLQEVIQRSAKVRLFSETGELANYMEQRFGLSVTRGFYLTCSINPLEPTRKAAGQYDTFRVGLLGAPRPGKGYERAAAIVKELSSMLDGASLGLQVEVLLQGSDDDYAEDGVYAFAKSFPSTADKLCVTCISNRLDPEDFEELFLSTDLILLPYDIGVYGLQGSGLVQDAVAAEKIIVHSKGISMQDFLSHGNANAVVSNREFAEAILEAATNLSRYTSGCVTAKKYFSKLLIEHPLLYSP